MFVLCKPQDLPDKARIRATMALEAVSLDAVSLDTIAVDFSAAETSSTATLLLTDESGWFYKTCL